MSTSAAPRTSANELILSRASAKGACAHCGLPLEPGSTSVFCCTGCESVHALLRDEKLDRYYDLRGDRGLPVARIDRRRRDRKWQDEIATRIAASDGIERIDVDVQGLHCSACVWLIDELFRREKAGVAAIVNPTLGTITLSVERGFDFPHFVEHVEAFGYLVGPRAKRTDSAARGLLFRLGLSVALTMNAMIFAFAIYAGLASGPIHDLFLNLELGLATIAVLVSGSVFFRTTLQALRRGVLHLDLPIALGIAASYAGSVHSWATGREPFFDTLCVFITLMLVGRFLQQRALEKNRRMLLEGDDVSGLLARKLDAKGEAKVVPCTTIAKGDRLVVAPFDLVPVDAVARETLSCSLDWINGESRPRSFDAGAMVPAGAFNAGACPVVVEAQTAFADSPLTEILRTPPRTVDGRPAETPFWKRYAPVYVTAVLVAAGGAFALWYALTRDAHQAIAVTTALLVITCPCAFGIATPLAYEIVRSGLRRRGLFVRSSAFLDRATMVRRVVFDKTGTVTEGTLVLRDRAPLDALEPEQRAVLAALVTASMHPKSVCVADALKATNPSEIAVTEVTGRGVEATVDGRRFRFGEPGWAAGGTRGARGDVAFGEGGAPFAVLATEERIREGAKREVERLRLRGYDVWMLSGDEPERVRTIARAVGIAEDKALGGMSPDDKARWIGEHDRTDTLMIGDGINDLPAVARAFCSGTPAVDRPFVAARSDFYFTTAGLGPITDALAWSRSLAKVVRRNLAVALAYNVIAVALCYAGLMTPLLCAVLMPLSSLSTILATVTSLNGGPRAEMGRK
jgi:Cu2+-exporting ATPase